MTEGLALSLSAGPRAECNTLTTDHKRLPASHTCLTLLPLVAPTFLVLFPVFQKSSSSLLSSSCRLISLNPSFLFLTSLGKSCPRSNQVLLEAWQRLKKILIYLWLHWVLVVACEIFCCADFSLIEASRLSCPTTMILVPQAGIKPISLALGGNS